MKKIQFILSGRLTDCASSSWANNRRALTFWTMPQIHSRCRARRDAKRRTAFELQRICEPQRPASFPDASLAGLPGFVLGRFIKGVLFLTVVLLMQTVGHADPLNHWNTAVSGTTNQLNAVLYTNNLFIVVGDAGTILTSSDGANWAAQTSNTTNSLAGVAYGNGEYVAVGANDTVLVSGDATNWTAYPNATGTNANWNSVCFGAGKFVVVGVRGISHQNFVYVSTDGIHWAQTFWSSTPPAFNGETVYTLSDIVFGNGRFAMMGNGEQDSGTGIITPVSAIFASSDTTNWSAAGVYTGDDVSSLAFANGQFVFSAWGNGASALFASADATNWTQAIHFPNTIPSALCGGRDSQLNNIVAAISGSTFYAGLNVGSTNDSWTSYNGAPFSPVGLAYGRNSIGTGVFAAVGSSNIYYSVVYTGAIVWTNTAGGNWSNPNNWSPNIVPGRNVLGSLDDVQISAPGSYTVVLDEGTSPNYWDIHSLTLGAGNGNGVQTLAMTNKILYVAPMTVNAGGVLSDNGSSFHAVIIVGNGGEVNSVNGTYFVNPLTIANGGRMTALGYYAYVTLHGNVAVDGGGVLTIPPGLVQVAHDGFLTVANGGLVNIQSGRLFLYGPTTNSGTVNLTGGSSSTDIEIYNNGTANDQGFWLNRPGGILNLTNSVVQPGAGPDDALVNQGTVVSAGSVNVRLSDFDNNGGVVSNFSGTLSLSTFTNTLAGTFYATNGATIQFHGGTTATPLTPGSPLVLLGAGSFKFMSGWLELPTNIIPDLQLVGGFLELAPTFQGGAITNLTLHGITLTNLTLAVTNGTFAVTGSTIDGDVKLENGAQLTAARGGSDINYMTPTFRNGVFVGNGATLSTYGGSFQGSVTVDGGGKFSDVNGGSVAPTGSMTVDTGGTLNVGYYFYLDGPLTNYGTVNVTSYNIQVDNNQTPTYLGGMLNEPGGTINLSSLGGHRGIDTGVGPDDYLINQGTIVGFVSDSINLSDFTNSGAITAETGTLNLNKVTLESSGSLNSRLNSASDYGKFSISGNADLTGAFNATLNGSYVPANGTTFNVLSYSSYSGNFDSYHLPTAVTWLPQYNSTTFVLVVGQPQFGVSRSGNDLIFDANGGTPGNQAVLLTSPDLTQPLAGWVPVTTNTFDANGQVDFTNSVNPRTPQRFFILEY